MKRINRIFFVLVCVVMYTNMTMHNLPASCAKARKEILIFHSYSPEYEWTRNEQQGIESVFENYEELYRVRQEYMDAVNHPAILNSPLLRQLYREKYGNTKIDVIICTDNAAFDFLRLYRDELFPGTPVVFCGVNGFSDTMLTNISGFTGVAEDNEFITLFYAIKKLQPNIKQIVIYGTPNDHSYVANRARVESVIDKHTGLPHVEFREYPSVDECIADAQQLSKDSAIMTVGGMRTAEGEGLHTQRGTEIMARAVNLPFYTSWDFGINHGAVGGLVVRGSDQGRIAAELAKRILEGESIDEIAVVRNPANIFIFDYKELKRFGFSEQRIPQEAVVVNAPDSTYQVNRQLIWFGLAMMAFLIIFVFTLMLNIQKRQRAEAALAASEEKFSKAFRHCADVIGILRLSDQIYIDVSDAFFNTFGYSRAEVIGKTAGGEDTSGGQVFRLWQNQVKRTELIQWLKLGTAISDYETCWLTKSGQERIGLYSAEIVSIGDQAYIVYVWHDITERKAAEIALQQAHDKLEDKVESRTQELHALNEELVATNQELLESIEQQRKLQEYLIQSEKMSALGSLVAGVTHEMNTPLGVSMTAASHLEQYTKEIIALYYNGIPEQHELIGYLNDLKECSYIIAKNLERTAKLVQSFKRVSADQSSEIQRIFNVRDYIEEILTSLKPQLKKTNHNILVECDTNLKVNGFPGTLSHILTNLLQNALVHAYDPGVWGTIRIQAKRSDKHLNLTFADDGKGMAADIRKKIFDPFFTTARGSGGTGLGLYIVYNLITNQFSGSIECESQQGKGTVFYVTLPFREVIDNDD